ncbi:MAG: preprotein translocase subunit SecG [Erysipelotrichaceae bacterium]|nr:preprotein translocase subunit SecG [Erysipelotrichaceae bacterium]
MTTFVKILTQLLDVMLMLVAVALILLSLLQSGKSDGISSAFSGSGGLNLFANVKERGAEKFISRSTLVLGIAFFVLVIVVQII